MENISLKVSYNYINVLIVIDTEYVKTRYPNPSKDPNNPTMIDHDGQIMLCTSSRGIISGQGSADLSFKAIRGDSILFFGQSTYANSDDAIVIYQMKHWQGDQVLQPFINNVIKLEKAVQPKPDTFNGLPAINTSMNSIFISSRVNGGGKDSFLVYFGLYKLANDGDKQELFGYYSWDATITISL